MLCIICDENPEKNWPKRWQCWKENGKFSESLCKLLGLPMTYKNDFQNSVYCGSCQKRVYNVYLMVRKWDKLQDEISKLKSRLKKDFQQSLQKSDASSEENEKSNWAQAIEEEEENGKAKKKRKRNSGDIKVDSSASLVEINTLIRKRILKQLEKGAWDCDCCCDTREDLPAAESSSAGKKGKSHCGFPDCQDKNCSFVQREDVTRGDGSGSEDNDDGASNSSRSDWSSHPESECDNELCGLCCPTEGHLGKKLGPEHDSKHNDPCSSEFCADCSICKHEAKMSKDLIDSNKRCNTWNNASCGGATVKTEIQSSGESPRENENTEATNSDALSLPKGTTQSTSSKSPTTTTTTNATDICQNVKKEPMLDEETTTTQPNQDDAGNDGADAETFKIDSVGRFRCNKPNCTRTFLSKEDMNIHVKRYHEGVKFPYVCHHQHCGKAFQWRRELNSHALKHSGGVAICCHLCGRGFRTKQLFGVHLKTKHGGERKYKCTMCDKSFISESKLNTHLTIHTKVYPFTCTLCGKGFSAKTFLNFHMSTHMEANPYQCTICSKTFSSPRNLKVHQFTHTNSHPYKCTICQAGTPSETLLKKHMLKHNSEKLNVCSTCNKRFRFPSSLKKHQKVHSGEKKFMCEYCNKTFIDKYKLTRHLRIHSGDKPFLCTICKQSFATKEYLNDHTSQCQCHKIEPSNNELDNSSSSLERDQSTELPPISPNDLQLLELDDPISAYLPDGFPTDPSFLDHINTADDDLMVTALDLERSFSKEELMMTRKPAESFQREHNDLENLVPNSIMLPDFQSLRRSSTQFSNDFPSFNFQ